MHTLVAICKKNPTNLNKAYVYACGWNTQYDRVNQSNYAVCLVYYRDRFSKKEQKMVSAPLEKIIESCIEDPTGKSQREAGSHRLSNDGTLVSLMGLALLYNNEEDEEEEEPEEVEPKESEEENGSNISEESPSESEPAESEPTESEPSEPAE